MLPPLRLAAQWNYECFELALIPSDSQYSYPARSPVATATAAIQDRLTQEPEMLANLISVSSRIWAVGTSVPGQTWAPHPIWGPKAIA